MSKILISNSNMMELNDNDLKGIEGGGIVGFLMGASLVGVATMYAFSKYTATKK